MESKRTVKYFVSFLIVCAACFGLQYLYSQNQLNFESNFHYSIKNIKHFMSGIMPNGSSTVKPPISMTTVSKAMNASARKSVKLEKQSGKPANQTFTATTRATSAPVKVTTPIPPAAVEKTKNLQMCPVIPPKLVGPLKVVLKPPSFEELEKQFPQLLPGGHFKPPDCNSRHKVAIVIPYRNRPEQLQVFLNHMHPMLQRQQLDYAIYVVEPALPVTFNRGMLMNVGFVEALKLYDWQCFVFHDVDLYPENDRNIYSCPEQPRHMTPAVDKFNYKLPYQGIFGGGSSFKTEHYKKINGFSNKYFGWGGEDDDLWKRVHNRGLKVIRYPMEIARYKMFKHTHEKSNAINPQRFTLLNTANQRQAVDGLNKMRYTVLKVEEKKLYTWVYVKIDKNEVMRS